MAGAFLTIIDTTYARQFPPTHQQDDGAFFNFFPRALTGTKQQQLREVCADKQCKTKTDDLPPNPFEVTRRTPSIYVWLAPISPKTLQGSTLKSCHREKKRKEKKTADLAFWKKKRKEELLFNPIAKPYFDFRNTVISILENYNLFQE